MVRLGHQELCAGKNIEAGDLAYFPSGATTDPGAGVVRPYVGFSSQFGFGTENMIGPYWKPLLGQARQQLRARGTVAAGVYHSVDPVTGRSVTTMRSKRCTRLRRSWPESGSPFLLPATKNPSCCIRRHSAHFNLAPGVEVKELGRFYDHQGPRGDVHLQMIRLSEGGRYHLDAEPPRW